MAGALSPTRWMTAACMRGPIPLGQLLEGLVAADALGAAAKLEVRSLADDSRAVGPGAAFFALRGTAQDGRRYVEDAVRRGATVVIGEELAAEAAGSAVLVNVADARRVLGLCAARWYGIDARQRTGMKLLGVTGTNGKSTTAFMTAAILRAAGQRCGLLGTVQYDLCARCVTASMTTPGPIELAGYLRECVDAGAQAAVMEVSSHALAQQRVAGLRFAAAAFTNLTQDHLDYHGTFEAYAEAKALLFRGLDEDAVAIVNADDSHHRTMIANCRARVLTYSMRGPADIQARITRDAIEGTRYRLSFPGGELVLENAVVGRHNVYNAMTAVGLALQAGAGAAAIEAGLASVRNIPGRLQRVPAGPASIFVDYAHTDDALQNVLSVLKPLTRGRLICVFGAGGDRDRGKRPKMAAAVAAHADRIIVTSDNPRTEDPERILDDVMAGIPAAAVERVLRQVDRRAAIRAAVAEATVDDVVLIAGKGHENYQILGTLRVHFDDVEEAIRAAAEHAGRPD